MTLPVCQHRGEITGDSCVCFSNRLVHAGTVSLAICLMPCRYADRENIDLAALRSAKGPPDSGPGTELRLLLESLGITDATGCGCASKAAEMDRWGVDGCREHRAEIVEWLAKAQREAGWLATQRAKAAALITGMAWTLDPLDPLGSLVDRAIEQAERKAAEKSR